MESNKEQWPEELDALLAAPKHHKLLFENEKVRVIDACIPSGETTELHTHKWPASLYVISWSDFVRYDSDGNIVLDSKNLAKSPSTSSAFWSGPLPPHTLCNTGLQDLHIISVEIKT
ncbi:hypothetical protein FRZ67_07215 [Panacibacter ginsenosidivorans]|uniref:Cupin domain-containing protein n=1 Tax=Panacibacter ginsenosidivorans TaxID=1813871 RepID=A0A5B8V6I1_9BACT|nr:hypothetical protein [Panacibacter ginsenosidivorans]QEC67087.1 hypothetical protein FRZ67_07215 [Panacibacter ginsenosidivorans]